MNLDSLRQKHENLTPVTNLLRDAGGHPYLVGGCVRDLCLGMTPSDLDIEVFGIEESTLLQALQTRYQVELVGKQFGVYIIKGLPFDIALPRTETKTGHKHTDFATRADPRLPLEIAASRRDFTINAMYIDLASGTLHDPHHGLQDLQHKILRHTSDQFSEDALRVYRAMQFIARFELTCHSETLERCKRMQGDSLPRERVWGEFKKLILSGVSIRRGLEFLRESTWIRYFPELAALVGCAQDPHWHPEGDVWNHTVLCMDAFAKRRTGDEQEDLIVGLATLCHDMGKPDTSFEENGRIRSPRHDKAGVSVATTFLQRLTHDQSILKNIPPLVREHMVIHQLFDSQAGDAALKRLSLRVEGRMDRLLRVCRADREGRSDPWTPQPFIEGEWIENRLDTLNIKSKAPTPLILGRDLIRLGLKPGPEFSVILEQLFHDQLEGKFLTHESGIEHLQKWLDKRTS